MGEKSKPHPEAPRENLVCLLPLILLFSSLIHVNIFDPPLIGTKRRHWWAYGVHVDLPGTQAHSTPYDRLANV